MSQTTNSVNSSQSKAASAVQAPLMRGDWISACRFHALNDKQVLDEVVRRVSELAGKPHLSSSPVVLLDLDSTLYEVGPRTYQILREWIDSTHSTAHGKVRDRLALLQESHVGYSLRDTFLAIGLSTSDCSETLAAWEAAKQFWQERFFTSDYLRYDRIYPGAAEFAQRLYDLGAELVYLTGRDEPNMGQGTRARLVDDRLPWNTERTHLLMKSAFEIDDLEHKQSAADFVQERGTLVASFENEPLNLVSLSEVFPDAMHIFVETICSDRPAPASDNLYRIRGFSPVLN